MSPLLKSDLKEVLCFDLHFKCKASDSINKKIILDQDAMTFASFERILWVFAGALGHTSRHVENELTNSLGWVETCEEKLRLDSRLAGTFIASIAGELEEEIGTSFSRLIYQLSEESTAMGSRYWFVSMPENSSPRGRAQVMWAVRVAFTHGNGRLSQISDPKVASWLDSAHLQLHFDGVDVSRA